MMWLAIVAIVMLFGGLTSAYMVRRGDPGWLTFDLPKMFYASTAVILLSSFTLVWAFNGAKQNNFSAVKIGTGLTLLLGLGFIYCQFSAWKNLVEQGIFIAGKTSNPAGSFLYVISGMHLLHLVGGIFSLLYVFIKSLRQVYDSKNLLGLQLCSMYWHFLDILWIYLFMFLYYAH